MPQKVNVERGKTHDVELEASSSTAPVKLGTSDAKGLIHLDGKLVAEDWTQHAPRTRTLTAAVASPPLIATPSRPDGAPKLRGKFQG